MTPVGSAIPPMWLDLEVIDFIDTAGSWEGRFPEPDEGDYLVTLASPDREWWVLVSRRYTAATDAEDAVSLAVDAVRERAGLGEGDVMAMRVDPVAERAAVLSAFGGDA